jgi:hypothetical protein
LTSAPSSEQRQRIAATTSSGVADEALGELAVDQRSRAQAGDVR